MAVPVAQVDADRQPGDQPPVLVGRVASSLTTPVVVAVAFVTDGLR